MWIEHLRTIPGFPDYAITRDGRVFSKPRRDTLGRKTGDRWLKIMVDKHGYLKVNLYRNRKMKRKRIHQLVLETWIGPRPDGKVACHRDGNSLNNKLSNLYLGTHTENERDKIRHGTAAKGERHPHFLDFKWDTRDSHLLIS